MDTAFTPMARLLAEQACRDVVLQTAACTDAGDPEGFAALFTADAVLVRPSGQALQGHEAIAAAYRNRPAGRITRHLICGTRITDSGPEVIEAVTQVLLWVGDAADEAGAYGRPAQQQVLGAFDDRLVHTPQGWRIARRTASFTLHAPVPG